MQEIIQSIVAKTGITTEQAQSALELTLSTVKSKLPESIASQLDGLLAGKEFSFKSVFNEQMTDLRDDAAEKLEELKEGAAETLQDLREGAAEKFENLKEDLKKMF